jgi:hypothetical protein
LSSRIPAVPSIDEHGSVNSHTIEPSPEEQRLIEAVEQAVKISAEIAVDSKDEMTQTPDEWMQGINGTIAG